MKILFYREYGGKGSWYCYNQVSESEIAQLCPTLYDSMDYSLPDSFVHGIFQAKVLEWVAIAFSATGPEAVS